MYDGRRHFPSCTDEPEAVPQHTPPENFMDTSVTSTSPLIFGTLTQMGTMNDLTNIHAHVAQNTPQNSTQITHQLASTKLLVHDEDDGSYQQEGTTHDAMIDCDIQEPEDDDINTCTMYKSKAALQISKAIGPQPILKVYDALRTDLKIKVSEKKLKPSHTEKTRYESLLAQIHTKVSSQKYELKRDIKCFETEHYQKHGVLPSRNQKDYDSLRKKLDYVRKLLTAWHNYGL